MVGGLRRVKAIETGVTFFGNNTLNKTDLTTNEDSDSDNNDPLKRIENHLHRSPYTIFPGSLFKLI